MKVRLTLGFLAAVLLSSACVPRPAAPAGAPVADPALLAADLVARMMPASPRRAAFAWTLDEAGTRLAGRGVARFNAPDHLRLDLFGPRGETYLAAAQVYDSVRAPVAVSERIAIPSPALLWGAVGVLRPPPGGELLEARVTDSTAFLRYRAGNNERIEFHLSGHADQPVLERVERVGTAGVIESVVLTRSAAGDPRRAKYRNWAEFRDLSLEFESITDVSAFPESVWNPAGAAR